MNTKFRITKSIGLLALLLFVLIFSNGLQAQSLKKTFKYIKEGEIAKADVEVQEFKGDPKTSVEDLMLHGLASCLIICNENYQNYDPYKSLELFKTTSEIIADKAEVDKFLAKYELSITKVQEIIYQSIFSQAQKTNTEASYQKALSVCEACSYKNEAIKHKETAAYNEAKNSKSVDGYKYFIGSYQNSEHITKIKNLLYEAAFQSAKANMSLMAMNDYLKAYSNNENKFVKVATHLRDSIAFSRVNKSYDEYIEFASQYPQSELIPKVLEQLPALLFVKAQKEKNIDLFEYFISQYPEDSKVTIVNAELGKLYYEKLLHNITKAEVDKFKERFPNSKYQDSLNIIISKIIANNDWGKDKLSGMVKSISFIETYENRVIKKEFTRYDEFGRTIISSVVKGNKDSLVYGFNGLLTGKFKFNLSELDYSKESYIYNKNGDIIEIIFESGIPNGGTEAKYLNNNIFAYSYNSLGKIEKYKNLRGQVTEYKYDKNGNLLEENTEGEVIQYLYGKNGTIIESNTNTGRDIIQTAKFNSKGGIIESIFYSRLDDDTRYVYNHIINKYDDRENIIEQSIEMTDWSKDEGKLVILIKQKKSCFYEFDKAGNWIKCKSSGLGYNRMLGNVSELRNSIRTIEYY